ncbi:hypothetical protein Tco_0031423 [Tanacetum coccineum]
MASRSSRLHFGMIPGIKPEPLKIAKTEQRAPSFAGRDPDYIHCSASRCEEMLRLRALGSNTESGVPYISATRQINAMGSNRESTGAPPGVGMVTTGTVRDVLIPTPPPPPQCTQQHRRCRIASTRRTSTYQTGILDDESFLEE